jgi:hypothetical protein
MLAGGAIWWFMPIIPATPRGRDRITTSLRPTWAKLERPYLKNKN